MFLHNFKYFLKILLKNRVLVFWTLAFPLILGTFFNLAFSDIENSEAFDYINIAIIDNDQYKNNMVYNYAFNSMSSKSDIFHLFNIKYTTVEEADKLLEDKDIVGYLLLTDKPTITINSNGISESIFKSVVDEVEQINSISSTIYSEDISRIYSDIVAKYSIEVNLNNTTSGNMSYTMIEFYSLIAMTCLYGSLLSMYIVNQILPNISNRGKRIGNSPVSKYKLILSGLSASYVIQVVGLLLLFLYTVLVLGVDYGNNFLFVILLSLLGSFAGLCFGMFVSLVFKVNEGTKVGIIIAITMVFSFLSGMMGITMKYLIDKNVPIINQINPVNMITDGLYSLYYYDTYNRFIFNMISLGVFSGIMIFASGLVLRRQKYDSI